MLAESKPLKIIRLNQNLNIHNAIIADETKKYLSLTTVDGLQYGFCPTG